MSYWIRKIKGVYRAARSLAADNQHILVPASRIVRDVTDHISLMKSPAGAFDYLRLGLKVKTAYDEAFPQDPYQAFMDPRWSEFPKSFNSVIYDLLSRGKRSTLSSEDGSRAYLIEIDGVRFGSVHYDTVERVFYEGDSEYLSVLRKLFWARHSNHAVLSGPKNQKEEILVRPESVCDQYDSPRAHEYYVSIGRYLSQGINRSVLFYGPPGSGKSNLVRTVCRKLGFRTLRINVVGTMASGDIADFVEIFAPEAVIMEDIDNASAGDVSELLGKVEALNRQQKLTLATANRIISLDSALLRPGRFDEAVEVRLLEESVVLEMVEGDREIYEAVKEFPAAFIAEVMKRVRVKGKVAALSGMEDLRLRLKNQEENNYAL